LSIMVVMDKHGASSLQQEGAWLFSAQEGNIAMAVNVIWEQVEGGRLLARVSLKSGVLLYEVLNAVGVWSAQPGLPADAMVHLGRLVERLQSSLANRVAAMDAVRDRLLTAAGKSPERGSTDLGEAVGHVEAEMARKISSDLAAHKRASTAEIDLARVRATIRDVLVKLGTPAERVMNPENVLADTANELHAGLERLKADTANSHRQHADELARAKSTAQVAIDLGMTAENVQRLRAALGAFPTQDKGTPLMQQAAAALDYATEKSMKEATAQAAIKSAPPYTIVLPPGCTLNIQQSFAPVR
jgi:hypothetical protein